MNSLFRDHLDKFILVFIADILIYSKNVEKHKQHLKKIIEILRANMLYAKLSKCVLLPRMLNFLVISSQEDYCLYQSVIGFGTTRLQWATDKSQLPMVVPMLVHRTWSNKNEPTARLFPR